MNRTNKTILAKAKGKRIIVLLVFSLCSCTAFKIERHMPSFIMPTDVLFKDQDGNCYFGTANALEKYSFDSINHYELAKFFYDDDTYWFSCSTNNSKYIILGLRTNDYRGLTKIKIFDKSLSLIDTLSSDNQNIAYRGMVCTDDFLYWREEDTKTAKNHLYQYSFSSKTIETIADNLTSHDSYEDDNISFFCNRTELSKYSEKTRLLSESIGNNYYLFTNEIQLSYKGNTIVLQNSKQSITFDIDKKFNDIYSKAYLIGNQLLFAIYRHKNDANCGYSHDGGCICSWKESYLYAVDLSTNNLRLIKEYEPGTILIDYDLQGAQYYYNGCLYDHDVAKRECEKITPGESKVMDYFDYFQTSKLDYHISYYNGEFYGI